MENVNITAGVSICNCDLYMMATKKVVCAVLQVDIQIMTKYVALFWA